MLTISISFQAKTFPTRSSLWWRRSVGICSTCWRTFTGRTLKRRWLWSCRDTWTHCTHISSSSSGNSTWSTPRRPASWTTCRRCCAPPCPPIHTIMWPRDELTADLTELLGGRTKEEDDKKVRGLLGRAPPSLFPHRLNVNWSKGGDGGQWSAVLIPAQIGVNVSYRTNDLSTLSFI